MKTINLKLSLSQSFYMSTDPSTTHFTIKSTQGVFPAPTDLLIFHQDKAPTYIVHFSETALQQVRYQQSHDFG